MSPFRLTFRNYHVFYYLLLGATEEEQKEFSLLQPEDYLYLTQVWRFQMITVSIVSIDFVAVILSF